GDFYSPAANQGPTGKIPGNLEVDYRQAVDGYRAKLGKEPLQPNEQISPAELKMIEDRFGYRDLHYDESGVLVAKETGAKLDPELADRVTAHYWDKFGLKPGEKFTPEQLEQIAKDSGIDPKILAYDKNGDLVIKGTLGHSGDQYGKYFLTPRAGEPATDANAYYRLAKKFGVDPVDAVTFKPGQSVTVGGRAGEVLGSEG